MILSNAKERDRFMRFAIVGIIGAVIDFGLFNLFSAGLHVAAIIASVISFTAAVVSNFLWNRFWTYPDSRSKQVTRQIIQFIVVSVVGLGIRTPLFAWLESRLVAIFASLTLRIPLTPVFLGHNLALAVAVVVVMFWNFFANRYWTYSDVK